MASIPGRFPGIAREAQRSDAPSAARLEVSNPAHLLLASLSGAAGVIHLVMVPSHMDEWALEGIGFALPSNHVLAIAQTIIAAGADPERPTIGAEHLELDTDSARRAGLSEATRGVLITAVLPGGPADAAGIAAGDVLTAINGTPVGAEYPLLNALLDKSPGEVVTVVLDRNGAMVETQVQLGRRS